MKQAILLMTNRYDYYIIEQIRRLWSIRDEQMDMFLLFNCEGTIPASLKPYESSIYKFSNDIIYQMGYKPLGDNLVYGNCHFPVLKFYLEHKEYDFYWIIEDDVTFNGEWSALFDYYKEDDTDLISTHISRITETPNWVWWRTLVTGKDVVSDSEKVSSFNPIYRLSNRALCAIHESLLNGWGGHAEAVLSSILARHGLSIKDMGGTGSFTPKCDVNRFYTKSTHSFQSLSIQDWVPNTLYHPIKRRKGSEQLRRNCVISAVGSNSLHNNWVKGLKERSFDLHLIVYDNSFSQFYNDGDFVSAKKGYKLRLVYDYLKHNPEYLDAYDYFFIPDDDILTDAKEIEKLFKTMKQYDLKIAQPALHDSYYTYPITLRDTLCKLRYTTFVEMMLPCFSKKALKQVLETFNANNSGWGIEYHWPILIYSKGLDMAVIDEVAMVHTRPVQQGRQANVEELRAYLKDHHLTPDVREIATLPLHPQYWVKKDFNQFRVERKRMMQQIEQQLEHLISKITAREIVRKGLDGICGLALLCLEIGEITGKVRYVSVGKNLMNQCEDVALDYDNVTFKSFYAGDLGIIWAYRRFRSYSHLSVASINKYLGPVGHVEGFKDAICYEWKEVMTMDTISVMYMLMKFIAENKKSELNQMLFECWTDLRSITANL